MNILLHLISFLHFIVIIFVLFAPFTNSNYLMFMHFVIVPFIMFHWFVNDNTCCLTVAEKMIKEYSTGKPVDKKECYSYKLVAPIYDFNKNHEDFTFFTYVLTTSLWAISGYKLYSKYENGQITKFQDLMIL